MSIAKITEAFKDKRFVQHEFFTMKLTFIVINMQKFIETKN